MFSRPLCNGRRETAPCIGRWSFPLCWRCTAVLAGWLAWRTLAPAAPPPGGRSLFVALSLVVPCLVDGGGHYLAGVPSRNVYRIVTGLLAGIGLAML